MESPEAAGHTRPIFTTRRPSSQVLLETPMFLKGHKLPRCSAITARCHQEGSDKDFLIVTPGKGDGSCYSVFLLPNLSSAPGCLMPQLLHPEIKADFSCSAFEIFHWFPEFIFSIGFSGSFAVDSGNYRTRQLALVVGTRARGCIWLADMFSLTSKRAFIKSQT